MDSISSSPIKQDERVPNLMFCYLKTTLYKVVKCDQLEFYIIDQASLEILLNKSILFPFPYLSKPFLLLPDDIFYTKCNNYELASVIMV